ncbi:MAG: sulfite exporter TauE/SafE family protein [Arenicella sp.]|nr:sulfite exporter TauE/SafE family protein [Arenicella sp.]
MLLELILICLVLGGIVGVMAGLLGIGGGAIMVPALVMLFQSQGFHTGDVMHLALGTSMASIVATSYSSMRTHNANGYVSWNIVSSMSAGVLIGAFLFSFIASILSALTLSLFFAVFMAYVSIKMFLNLKPVSNRALPSNPVLALIGSAIGGVSTLVSIGGGSLTVPFLVSRNIDIKTAIGSSAAIGLPISLAATLGYVLNGTDKLSTGEFTLGYVYWPAVLAISATSFITAPIGATLAHRLPVALLKKCFAILLIVISIKVFLSFV